MKVAVIGTGYVGLVSGICFAEIGHDVICIDINTEIIKKLNNNEVPIYEPGLGDLLQRNLRSERIKFSTSYESICDAKVIFIAVGTPSADTGEADLKYVWSAAESIAQHMREEAIVVLKSTVPVGTHKQLRERMENKTNKKFFLVNNPEFLKEGSAIEDFMRPDRVVIGYREPEAFETMKELYTPLVRQGNPIIRMSNASAEMTKYASNSLLATRITFINEIARFCDKAGADVEQVRKGMISDRRIGPHFLYPGPGFGGSCFPKDVRAIAHTSKEFGIDMEIPRTVMRVNETQKTYMFHKMINHFGDISGMTFAIWGVAFKANTDDIREAPAISMATELIKKGASVHYYDPEASLNFEKLMESNPDTRGKTRRFENKYNCLNGCDAMVVMTEWREFSFPDFSELRERLSKPVIFDARNIFKTRNILGEKFEYYAVGKYIPTPEEFVSR
ncbi:MAG: UDP-glucose/GDP-mannose dehydrogenase family protein [Bacteriovoracaceae bacterium]|nr:UDP-glucose/GDP-mannose dehydrogenase family protein [Bacteriovoracaceae bacterium]